MARSKGIPEMTLEIPADEEWPVIGRDPLSGDFHVRGSFVRSLEQRNGLEPGTLHAAVLHELIFAWYSARRQRGDDVCLVMEQILAEEAAARQCGLIRVSFCSPSPEYT